MKIQKDDATAAMQDFFPNGGRDWDQVCAMYDAIAAGKIPGVTIEQQPTITSLDTDPRRSDFYCRHTASDFYITQLGSVPGREFALYRNEVEALYLSLRDALCAADKVEGV
ncbi:MAG: hypothetical protein ACRDCA_12570 [Serratia sp. (in: enterobacteria)]|uniref:hypothetical protein n=1 Tax=Serratia sp. (in: enterobacteria) TaxID=616 RepID=UPI003F40EC33